MANQIVVVGLGRFGSALAEGLTKAGHEVLGIDRRSEPVRELAEKVSKALQGDATRPAFWSDLPVKGAGIAIVAFSDSVEANVLTAVLLRKAGFKRIIAKSSSDMHSELLQAIGVSAIIDSDKESAGRLAHTLGVALDDYMPVTTEFGVAKVGIGRAFTRANIKKLYDARHVTVLALLKGDRVILQPDEQAELQEGETVIVGGRDHDLREFAEANWGAN